MLERPKTLAPEPYLSAYLELLYRVSIFIRSRSEGENRLPDEQLYDLMDAIHNIPEMLIEYEPSGYKEREMVSYFLKPYDDKWAKGGSKWVEGSHCIALVAILDEAIRSVQNRDSS